jgi:putative oxidoreductase
MTVQKQFKALHISLWVVQVLLALAFGMAGFMKLIMPISELAENGMGFVNHTPEGLVRFIGLTEVLGACGLIFPSVMRIKPGLTPLAAIGLAIIMLLAIYEHITQNEPIVANFVLLTLSIFVAWGRYKTAPIHAKS